MNTPASHFISFPIRDIVDLRIAISKVRGLSWLAVASEVDRSLIATILSELGTNIIKYAYYGHLDVRRLDESGGPAVEITARDNGPGIADVNLALRDSFTTGNSLGLGLPGVRRMADSFHVSSEPGRGTTIVATKRFGCKPVASKFRQFHALQSAKSSAIPSAEKTGRWDVGAFTRPMYGQIKCGDLAIINEAPETLLLVMADVTGHGDRAFEICQLIRGLVSAQSGLAPHALMDMLHRSLEGTIGAAMGILEVDIRCSQFSYLAVGNTGMAHLSKGVSHRGISKEGIVGARLPSPIDQSGILEAGDAVVMWTDGIPENTGPRFLARHANDPAQHIARELVVQHGKMHDDAGCIVLRWLK